MTGPTRFRVVGLPAGLTILSERVFHQSLPNRLCRRILLGIFLATAVLIGTAYSQPATPAGPNVFLTEAAFFLVPEGDKVMLTPGRYLVEAVGARELRLTPTSGGRSTIIRAESLRHEQYELFSPFALTRPGAGGRIHIALLLPGGLQLEAVGETRQPPSPPKSEQPIARRSPASQDDPATKPVPSQLAYNPPRDRSSGARVTAGTAGGEENVPRIVPLAPDHVGLTTKEQPMLYWYLSQALNDPVDVVISVMGESHSNFEARLVPPFQAGVQTLSLAEFGVRLPSKVPYQWRVSSRGTGESKELIGGGGVMRIPIPDQLSSDLVRAGRGDFPHLYAQSGIWYDALAAISDLIAASPTDSTLRQQRAALLEQVGLDELARLDRDARLVSR